MNKHYDLIVIGGGSAGYAAARTYREHRENVAIVDGGDQLGGLCILKGCMPSKTLLYVADVLHHAQNGKKFGLSIPDAQPDIKAIHERKKKLIGEFTQYRVDELESDRFDLYKSDAKFVSENSIELNSGETLSADYFIISTGSRINFPQIPGLDSVASITSDDVLDIDYIPKSVIVLGGGIVACELAQFLNRMGSDITVIQRSKNILKDASTQASDVVTQAFRDEGIKIFTGTKINKIVAQNESVNVEFEFEGKKTTVKGEKLFNALGRIPNTANLGLENAGIEINKTGHIKTNEYQQTTNAKIYATGDCAGPHEIVHIAVLQGELASKHILNKNPQPLNYDTMVNVVFTDPQLATVGFSEKLLIENGLDFISAEYPFDDLGKSILMEAKYGYVKIFVSRTDEVILGAECVGKDAGELIHSLTIAVTLKATVSSMLKAHWYHPTLSEIWTYPMEEILEELENKF